MISKSTHKLLGLILLSLLYGSKVEGQAYIPMLNEKAEWHLTWCDVGCKTEIYYTDGDTLDSGYRYKVLNGFHYISRSFWLREEVSSQQVWLSLVIDRKRQEFLLYDFSLQVGDSIAMYNPISPFPQEGGIYYVDSIVPKLLLDGLQHRVFYFSPSATVLNPQSPVWVEGLGSLSLINAPGGTPTWIRHGQVSCYFKESGQVYEDLDTTSACNLRYLNLNSESVSAKSLIYDRLRGEIYFEGRPDALYVMSLVDSQGRSHRFTLQAGADGLVRLAVGSYPDGIYLVMVEDKLGLMESGKFFLRSL